MSTYVKAVMECGSCQARAEFELKICEKDVCSSVVREIEDGQPNEGWGWSQLKGDLCPDCVAKEKK